MRTDIQIVDNGRGLQLSTSRVTVQDLVPYFQDGCSYEEIVRWIPTLTPAEISVVELGSETLNGRTPPWVEKIAAEARAERNAILEKLEKAKANGEAR